MVGRVVIVWKNKEERGSLHLEWVVRETARFLVTKVD